MNRATLLATGLALICFALGSLFDNHVGLTLAGLVFVAVGCIT